MGQGVWRKGVEGRTLHYQSLLLGLLILKDPSDTMVLETFSLTDPNAEECLVWIENGRCEAFTYAQRIGYIHHSYHC